MHLEQGYTSKRHWPIGIALDAGVDMDVGLDIVIDIGIGIDLEMGLILVLIRMWI